MKYTHKNGFPHLKPKKVLKNDHFILQEDTTLLPFLIDTFEEKSRSKIKSILYHGQVRINGETVTQFDAPIKKGDFVTILRKKVEKDFSPTMMERVFEDDYIIVVNKREGLLSIANNKTQEKTAYYVLNKYFQEENPDTHIFIVHRLDRETSGLMIFAKSIEVQHLLQKNWLQWVKERKYIALLEGNLEREEGVISTYLAENKNLKMYVPRREEGERAITEYRVKQQYDGYSLVEFSLRTGKKNQIRAHCEYLSHPIVGDKKYGSKINPIGRVALHAYKLTFLHPKTGELINLETPMPKSFLSLIHFIENRNKKSKIE
ncbi:MAG TPA: RNA pseudouridine synthase [Porphyromonadaceae bacterium]|nr:RNA pseudouridine synthase [Porphyromonadaceae bacterium]